MVCVLPVPGVLSITLKSLENAVLTAFCRLKLKGHIYSKGRYDLSQTFTGAVELFNQNNLSPNSWMRKVASKEGTRQAALDSMNDNNVGELIKEAAFAAFNRAVELGREKNKM